MDPIPFETASLEAWPAFVQQDKNGWISRFTMGYTKRSNSVTILNHNRLPPEEQIKESEKSYNGKNLPCIFRLLSFNDNREIEEILNARGYTKDDHSLVMAMETGDKQFPDMEFGEVSIQTWMEHYCRLSIKRISDHKIHTEIIKNIKGEYLPALLKDSRGNVVSCGLGVATGSMFGIFDIVTHPEHRKKGHGFGLISGMLNWARHKGAKGSYVQVIRENLTAIRLYHRLGYRPLYEYHYKIQNFTKIPGDQMPYERTVY